MAQTKRKIMNYKKKGQASSFPEHPLRTCYNMREEVQYNKKKSEAQPKPLFNNKVALDTDDVHQRQELSQKLPEEPHTIGSGEITSG